MMCDDSIAQSSCVEVNISLKAGSASVQFGASFFGHDRLTGSTLGFRCNLNSHIRQSPACATEAMIVRGFIRCSVPRRLQILRPRSLHAKQRRYSTSTSSSVAATSAPASSASMLGSFTNEFDRIAPKFEIHGSQVDVLRSPAEFYETLKVGTITKSCTEGYVLMGHI